MPTLLLGRLDPENFLGGEMKLDTALAREAMIAAYRRAARLHGAEDEPIRAAKGVLTIANLTMSSIIKKISIARGYDPRDFALFCYGGGGPLHGIELARALKIPRVIVPPEPGNFSAVGMLLADPRIDIARTFIVQLNPENLAKVARGTRANWNPKGARRCAREFGEGTVTLEREVEMRYKGQHHSIKIRIAETDDAGHLRARFDREYLRRYGHANSCGGGDRGAALAGDAAHEAAGHRPSRPRQAQRQAAASRNPADFLPGGRSLPADRRSTIAMRWARTPPGRVQP